MASNKFVNSNRTIKLASGNNESKKQKTTKLTKKPSIL